MSRYILIITFLSFLISAPNTYAWSKRTVYGKTMCEDAIAIYLKQKYKSQASQRKEVLKEYNRVVSTYLSPTDWNDVATRNYIKKRDNRYFTSDVFGFGENTKLGPIVREAFNQLPDSIGGAGDYEGPHKATLSFSHFVDFNNYQYFFCLNKRVFITLKKELLPTDDSAKIEKLLVKKGHKIISQRCDEDETVTIMTEKKNAYHYFKIFGKECYIVTFDPRFAKESKAKNILGKKKSEGDNTEVVMQKK